MLSLTHTHTHTHMQTHTQTQTHTHMQCLVHSDILLATQWSVQNNLCLYEEVAIFQPLLVFEGWGGGQNHRKHLPSAAELEANYRPAHNES